MNKRIQHFIEDFYLVLTLPFLYLPIFMMIVFSSDESKSRARWGGFTLRQYGELFSSVTTIQTFYDILLIAFLSALIVTVFGMTAVVDLHAMKCTGRNLMIGLNNIPVLDTDIVAGISLMLTFIAFRFMLGSHTVLINRITSNIPCVLFSVLLKLKQTNCPAYEAAMNLSVTPRQTLFYTVLPDIVPGVLSSFLLAFAMSLDDFIITHFAKGAGIDTLSTLIYSQVRRDIVPSMHVLSVIIFVAILLPLLVTNFTPLAKNPE